MEMHGKQPSFHDCSLTLSNNAGYNVNVGSLKHTSMRKTIIPDTKEKMEKRNYCHMEAACQENRA